MSDVNFSIRMSAELRDALGDYNPRCSAAAATLELVYAGTTFHIEWATEQVERIEAQILPGDQLALERRYADLAGYRAMIANCTRVQSAIVAMGKKKPANRR